MPKTLILFSLIGIACMSCFTVSMQKNTYGNRYVYKYEMVQPHRDSILRYEDGSITARFGITSDNIIMVLNNKSKGTLMLPWDDVTLIYDGETNNIVHKTVRFTDIGKPMAPTTMAPGGSIEDIVVPVKNVAPHAGGQLTGVDWEMKTLFPIYDNDSPRIRREIISNVGNTLGLRFPLVDDRKNKTWYYFEFKIKSIECINCMNNDYGK